MTKTLTRVKNGRFCRLEVELRQREHGPVLSICGTEGYILKPAQARKEAREYWESFFDECPEELARMRREYRKLTPKSAARFVVDTDGEYHGLDVLTEDDRGVYIIQSCGQIVDDLREWFPEVIPFLPYHLNDMKAECIHQEARGERYTHGVITECPDCGWKAGHGWNYRPLPPEVIAWAENLGPVYQEA